MRQRFSVDERSRTARTKSELCSYPYCSVLNWCSGATRRRWLLNLAPSLNRAAAAKSYSRLVQNCSRMSLALDYRDGARIGHVFFIDVRASYVWTWDEHLRRSGFRDGLGTALALTICQRGLVASPKHLRNESQISSHTRPIPQAHGVRLVASPSHAPCGISFYGLVSQIIACSRSPLTTVGRRPAGT